MWWEWIEISISRLLVDPIPILQSQELYGRTVWRITTEILGVSPFFILIYHLLSKLVISKEISHSLERKGFLRKIIIQSMLTSEIVATKIEHLFQVLCNYKKRLKIEISARAIENLN